MLGCVVYQFVVHSAMVEGQPEPVRLVLIALPLILLTWWVATRSANKPLWLAILLLAAAGTYLLKQQEQLGLAAAYGIPHAAIYLALLWFFGRTLRQGWEPLITRLARRVHGEHLAAMAGYTRGVTIAWCVFFAVQLLASALLFEFATLNTWSLFINLLNLPLLAAMFAGEYLYRSLRYPNHPKTSITKAIRAFTDDSSLSKSAEVR